MRNYRPILVLIYQYDGFHAHLHKKILQFTAKNS